MQKRAAKILLTVAATTAVGVAPFCGATSLNNPEEVETTVYAGAVKELNSIVGDALIESDKMSKLNISANISEPVSSSKHIVSYSKGYTQTRVNLRKKPSISSEKIITVNVNTRVKYIDSDTEWVEISTNNHHGYMKKKYIGKKKKKIDKTPKYSWNGEVLNRRNGVVTGPSGKESYYNLDMSGVINIMRRMGNNDRYWIRDDGVKMLGDYVMCAADLSIHPRGSHVPTSLGMGVVVDTGTFIYSNNMQLDVCTAW
ncbi:SH3 domain-containing protein [Lachnospiraceae bacterium KHCPX20]|nr:SH3 domain-containing protein [Lachnospiraceae bacterium KHCPX20]